MKGLAPIASENPDSPFTWEEIEQLIGSPDYSSYYQILSLPENYTKEELEKAYKKTRIKYHPDKPDGDKEKFAFATEAYLRLKDLLRHKSHAYER